MVEGYKYVLVLNEPVENHGGTEKLGSDPKAVVVLSVENGWLAFRRERALANKDWW